MRVWQATKARGALSAIIDAAVDGAPQLIRRRDGKEVVVMSRAHYEAHAQRSAIEEDERRRPGHRRFRYH
jgi:prevent-host-death family protein